MILSRHISQLRHALRAGRVTVLHLVASRFSAINQGGILMLGLFRSFRISDLASRFLVVSDSCTVIVGGASGGHLSDLGCTS